MTLEVSIIAAEVSDEESGLIVLTDDQRDDVEHYMLAHSVQIEEAIRRLLDIGVEAFWRQQDRSEDRAQT